MTIRARQENHKQGKNLKPDLNKPWGTSKKKGEKKKIKTEKSPVVIGWLTGGGKKKER